MRIDLNCDMGESFGAYKIGSDEQVIKYITSASIACGWHAGDPMVMDKTVKLAVEHGVGIGAHPGYPDLLGFGRRNMTCSPEEIRNYVIYQIGALQAFCVAHGTQLRHVKPHGNLYNTAVESGSVARAIAEAVVNVSPNLIYVALAGAGGHIVSRIGKELGLKVVHEAFADRAYTPEGTLVSRSRPGAVIKDKEKVADRVLMMAKEGKVIAMDGTEIPLAVQTICLHGDTPGAVDLVKAVRDRLESERIEVRPMGWD